MGAWAQISDVTGTYGDVFRYYWEDGRGDGGTGGAVAAISGLGTNRFTITSAAALVHIAANSRYEWEGNNGILRHSFVGYFNALGKTIDFNNSGQTPAVLPLSASTTDQSVNIFDWNFLSGGVWNQLGKIDGRGRVYAPAFIGSGDQTGAPGTALTGTTSLTTLATLTQLANTMGPTGQIDIEGFISCIGTAGTKTVSVSFGGTTYFSFPILAASTGQQFHIRIANKTASSQIAFNSSVGSGYGATTSATVTSTVNTASNVTILITGQLANSADTMTLESYRINTTYGA
jgi:hypothetical protein